MRSMMRRRRRRTLMRAKESPSPRIPPLRRRLFHHLYHHCTHHSPMRWVGLLPRRHTCRSTPPFSSPSPTSKMRFPGFGRVSQAWLPTLVASPGAWTPMRRESPIFGVSLTARRSGSSGGFRGGGTGYEGSPRVRGASADERATLAPVGIHSIDRGAFTLLSGQSAWLLILPIL